MKLNSANSKLLVEAAEKVRLTARGYHRVPRVARVHVAALLYRRAGVPAWSRESSAICDGCVQSVALRKIPIMMAIQGGWETIRVSR